MKPEEKWDELRSRILKKGITFNCGGGWDEALMEVLVDMECLDDGIEYKNFNHYERIARKHGIIK